MGSQAIEKGDLLGREQDVLGSKADGSSVEHLRKCIRIGESP